MWYLYTLQIQLVGGTRRRIIYLKKSIRRAKLTAKQKSLQLQRLSALADLL